jgi:EmrB/QacA subfamily drug resistance transporter
MAGHRTPSKWMILSAVMVGVIMGPIDGSIVNVVLPDIARYFGADYSIAQWVPTIYLLAVCSFILLYGRLGDMLGYKRIFLTGVACFVVASFLCGFSQNIWMLIVFRAVQGLSVAMEMALGLAIVTEAFPTSERGKAIGIYATAIATGLMVGPVLGGLIAQYLSWRYVFFINVPIGAAALVWASRILPSGGRKADQYLDWYGAVATFGFLFTIVLYADRGEPWGWTSGPSIGLLVLAAIFGGLFLFIERRAAQPMVKLSLFGNRRFSLACLSALTSFMALYALVFLTPWYLQDAQGRDVLAVGLIMIASPVVSLFVGPASGALSDRIGVRGLAFLGMAINAAGFVFLSQLDASSGSFEVGWRLAVCGLGSGMFQAPINSAIMGSVPPWHRGTASSMLAVMRNAGMAFGIAVAGAIVYNLAPSSISDHTGHFTGQVLGNFVDGLHWAYLAGAALAGLAGVAALFAKAAPVPSPEVDQSQPS